MHKIWYNTDLNYSTRSLLFGICSTSSSLFFHLKIIMFWPHSLCCAAPLSNVSHTHTHSDATIFAHSLLFTLWLSLFRKLFHLTGNWLLIAKWNEYVGLFTPLFLVLSLSLTCPSACVWSLLFSAALFCGNRFKTGLNFLFVMSKRCINSACFTFNNFYWKTFSAWS